jgi:hypothetical protein
MLVGNPYFDNTARVAGLSTAYGGASASDNFESYLNATFNSFGPGNSAGNAILGGTGMPQLMTNNYNYSMNEIWSLKKEHHEQKILIDNLASMISRLYNENEMRDNKINKLESQWDVLTKIIEDYKKMISVKIQEINRGGNTSSRQKFEELYSGGNSNMLSFNFWEHRDALFNATQNVNTSHPTVEFSKMSQLKRNDEDSRPSGWIDVTGIETTPEIDHKNVKNTKGKDEKRRGISIYNPTQPNTGTGYHWSMPQINSMTYSEAEAAKECEKVLNSTINQFSHEDDDRLVLDNPSSCLFSKDQLSSEFMKKAPAGEKSSKNAKDVELDSKPQRKRPKKKEKKSPKKQSFGEKRRSGRVSKAGYLDSMQYTGDK